MPPEGTAGTTGGEGTGGGSLLTTPPAATGGGAGAGSNPPTPAANSYPKEDWRHTLPDDLREDPSFRSFNDINSLAKSYRDTKKMVGADKVTLPNKHWTPEEYEAFYDRLGRPPVDKYNVNLPKEAKFVSQEWVKEMIPIAHKAGLRPEQLEPLLSFYEGKVSATQISMEEDRKKEQMAGLQALEKEWGEAYKQKISYAQMLIKENADLKEADYLDKSGLGNDPKLVRFMSKVGEILYKEDKVLQGENAGSNTPAEAEIQYNQIVTDEKHAYRNSDHPNHKAAVDEVKKLFEQMHPQEKGA